MKRAIILIPGFERREKNLSRDKLVDSLVRIADGWIVTKIKTFTNTQGIEIVSLKAREHQNESTYDIDVLEAYWGDMIPDWSNESPVERLRRGTKLIFYWLMGGLAKFIFKFSPPNRTIIGGMVGALFLFLWYISAVLIILDSFNICEMFSDYLNDCEIYNELSKKLNMAFFLISFLLLGPIEKISNIAAFTKGFLQDTSFTESHIGVRTKSKKRVLDMLDSILDVPNTVQYDEIYIVAHSLGGAIAVDALAAYGKNLQKITLITWGSALGALVQQEPLLEDTIKKLCQADYPLKQWHDVVYSRDYMGSEVAQIKICKELAKDNQFVTRVPVTFTPKSPKGISFLSYKMHDSYYISPEVIQMLVKPDIDKLHEEL